MFWVAALAGIVVFGSLMGAIFVGQQFEQNVLGYSTLDAGSVDRAGGRTVDDCDRSLFGQARGCPTGSRITLLCGYVFCLLGFLTMLLLWKDGIPYWKVGLGYAFIGVGVGFAGTPASHSLTGSVPVKRAGMASGTADLQRDLGGAIMQSIMGALLTAGYAAAVATQVAGAPNKARITETVETELTKSFSSAAATASRYPQYAKAIVTGAKESFVKGDEWAFAAGLIAIALGTALVFFAFPHKRREGELTTEYHTLDADTAGRLRTRSDALFGRARHRDTRPFRRRAARHCGDSRNGH